MINSVTKGKLDEYLQAKMQDALNKNASEVNTGGIDLSRGFKDIFDQDDGYRLSKDRAVAP